MGRFGELADLAFPATNKDCAAAGPCPRQQVWYAITDQVAIFERNAQISSGSLEQANFRLSAPTRLAPFGKFRLRVVEAIVDSVEVPASSADASQHGMVKLPQRFRREVALSDARLVRDHSHGQTEIVQRANGLGNARQQLELGKGERPINYPRVLMIDQRVDDAVAVQQNSLRGFAACSGPPYWCKWSAK